MSLTFIARDYTIHGATAYEQLLYARQFVIKQIIISVTVCVSLLGFCARNRGVRRGASAVSGNPPQGLIQGGWIGWLATPLCTLLAIFLCWCLYLEKQGYCLGQRPTRLVCFRTLIIPTPTTVATPLLIILDQPLPLFFVVLFVLFVLFCFVCFDMHALLGCFWNPPEQRTCAPTHIGQACLSGRRAISILSLNP